MTNRTLKKISSQAGETIGETLVALLISALALVMLAGAVSAAMRVVTSSKAHIDAYYQVNNAVVARATSAPTVNGTEASGFGTGTLNISVSNLLPAETIAPQAYWKNTQLSGVSVIVYAKPTPTPST